MFEAYRNDLRKNQKEHKMVDITVSSNINVNHNLFKHQLNPLDSLTDEENDREVERAIDEIIKLDPFNIYRKISK